MTSLLAMISFIAPWMAWGAVAALGLPVLAHLLSRTRYREVVFPAARLVRQAAAATSRIETPRHRLLMLLRWLVLMLLVLAFMRPQWTPSAEARGEDSGVTLIILVDASASMQRIERGVTLYDRAKRDTSRLLDQLDPARDAAAIVRVDHAPASLLPKATGQLSLLTDQIDDTEPGYSHANWAGAIAAAQRLTRDQDRAVRVVTLSDQQGEQPDLRRWADTQQGVSVEHVRISGPSDNIAIRLVDVRPYPAIAGRPITATYELQSYNDGPTQVTLATDFEGEEISRPLTLGPGETRRVSLDYPTTDNANQFIDARINVGDAIFEDNEAGALVPMIASSRALVIHDADARSGVLAQRLALIINPGDVANAILPEVETVTTDQAERVITRLDPIQIRTVVLLNQQPLRDDLSQALEVFAQSGGGVVQFAVNNAGRTLQNTSAAAIDFDLEPLRIFEGPARTGLAGLVWPGVSNAAIDERAKPILLDDLERVIVAEMPRGRGRLIAINATLSPEPDGLLAQPAFVVLFNELCRYASPGMALPPPTHPGDPMPDDLREGVRKRGAYVWPIGFDPDSDVFTGLGYHSAPQAGTPPVFVSLSPTESDTRVQTPWTGLNSSDETPSAGSTSGIPAIRDKSIQLWPALLLLALGMIVTESLFLWRFAGPRQPAVQGGVA